MKMPTVKYNYSVLGRVFYIDCEVLDRLEFGVYRIRFLDPVSDEITEAVVLSEHLKFPKFSEFQYC